jgi:glycosyltransferase involved in cell wall biosynthesis
MSPISILLVIDGLEFGGGERVFLQLAAGLQNRHKLYAAAMPGGEFEKKLKKLHIQFFPIDFNRKVSLKPVCQIKKIIESQNIDVVHSQGARADFFARIATKLVGTPKVISTIAMPVEGFDIGIIRKTIYRLMDYISERYVERFIVVSDSLRQSLIERRRLPAGKIIRVHNGIELDQYNPDAECGCFREELSIGRDTTVITAIGRLVWQKGFEYLIYAVPAILNNYPDTKILIVGDGPLKKSLIKLTHRLDVGRNVIFTGYRDNIQQILSSTDLLVVPSLLEGFPMITLEAMAMAKPIVATKLPGIIEQLDNGKTGIVVPPKNSDALSQAVIKLLSDQNNTGGLGVNARQRVAEQFSVQKMIFKTEQVYQQLFT